MLKKRRTQMKIEDVKRFYLGKDIDGDIIIKDRTNDLVEIKSLPDAAYMLNKLDNKYDDLKRIFIHNYPFNDDGRINVWQVPPLKPGQRITTRTYGSEPK